MAEYAVPKGLKSAGLELWREVIAGVEPGWQLTVDDLTTLTECCRLRDTEARLERRVAREGDVVKGSTGSPVLNPALRELRVIRALVMSSIRRVQVNRPGARTAHLSKGQRDQLGDARRNRWR